MTMGVMPSTGSAASGGSDGAPPAEGGSTAPTAGPLGCWSSSVRADGAGHDRARRDPAAEHQEAARSQSGIVRGQRSRPHRLRPRPARHAGAVVASSTRRTTSPAPTATTTVTIANTCEVSGWRNAATSAIAPATRKPMTPMDHRRAGCDPQQRRDEQRTDDDGHVEHQLVVGAEEADHEVLGARRLERDDQVADGDDDRRRTGHDARDELGDRDGHERGDGARRGGGEIGGATGEWVHDT